MLNQSFSFENFRVLLDVENRKGNYLLDKGHFSNDDDVFKEARSITDKIIRINKEINKEYKSLPNLHLIKDEDYNKIRKLESEKEELKKEREVKIELALTKIANDVNDDSFRIEVKKGIVKYGSQLYITDNTIGNYLVLKQLQRNIYKTFGVKQADRKLIISQIKLLLNENFPKTIIRTDISKFYESIPHQQLINKIDENSLLNYQSKRIIKNILNQYWKILVADGVKTSTEERVGLPRGIGISAFLSELYLKDFDKIIRGFPNVIYYARYVDDIIVIFSPNHRKEVYTKNYHKKQIQNVIKQFHLEMNLSKTKFFDLTKQNSDRNRAKKYEITFLGYKFCKSFKWSKNKNGDDVIIPDSLVVSMSDAKLERIKEKIRLSFEDYKNDIAKYAGKERNTARKLIQRIKILTHNFRLYRRKSNVLIGIYFSNEFLTPDLKDLKTLDTFLNNEIITNTGLSAKTSIALSNLSFEQGFKHKKTLNFNFNQKFKRGSVSIQEIIKIWKAL